MKTFRLKSQICLFAFLICSISFANDLPLSNPRNRINGVLSPSVRENTDRRFQSRVERSNAIRNTASLARRNLVAVRTSNVSPSVSSASLAVGTARRPLPLNMTRRGGIRNRSSRSTESLNHFAVPCPTVAAVRQPLRELLGLQESLTPVLQILQPAAQYPGRRILTIL